MIYTTLVLYYASLEVRSGAASPSQPPPPAARLCSCRRDQSLVHFGEAFVTSTFVVPICVTVYMLLFSHYVVIRFPFDTGALRTRTQTKDLMDYITLFEIECKSAGGPGGGGAGGEGEGVTLCKIMFRYEDVAPSPSPAAPADPHPRPPAGAAAPATNLMSSC
ncbi:unnamed protein product, partial [Brenthis ino]